MTAVPAPPPEVPAIVVSVEVSDRRIIASRPGLFGNVVVVDEDGLRYLRFGSADGADQSGIDPRQPSQVLFEYVRVAALALDRHDTPKLPARALVIGVGGGAYPRLLIERVAHIVVDAVEIDPVVIDLARAYFALPTTKRLHIHVDDGAHFIKSARAGYDIVLLDAFSGEDMPSTLSTPAFFGDVRRVLADDGVVVLNVALINDAAAAEITARFAAAFPGCVIARAKTEENRILFGARRPMSAEAWRSIAVRSPGALGFDVLKDLAEISPCPGRR